MSGRIVVGIDGSDNSRRALQYAFEEARRRDASIEVVHAYQLPIYWGPPEFSGPLLPPTREAVERDARELVDRTIGHAPPDLQIKRVVAPGSPAWTLLRIAEGADLLIVGSRGRGGFGGLLLGSTSHQVIAHAPCPVVVVRAEKSAEPARTPALHHDTSSTAIPDRSMIAPGAWGMFRSTTASRS